MKILLGAALAAALIATPAVAQTESTTPTIAASPCGTLPAQPTLPDGATANREEMEEGNTAYRAWYEQYAANIQCRAAEATSLRTQYETRFAEHNAAVEALNAANATWIAEAEEFNGRTDRRRMR